MVKLKLVRRQPIAWEPSLRRLLFLHQHSLVYILSSKLVKPVDSHLRQLSTSKPTGLRLATTRSTLALIPMRLSLLQEMCQDCHLIGIIPQPVIYTHPCQPSSTALSISALGTRISML